MNKSKLSTQDLYQQNNPFAAIMHNTIWTNKEILQGAFHDTQCHQNSRINTEIQKQYIIENSATDHIRNSKIKKGLY